ncbi:MAG: 16S rRNA (cytosine(967)-C(5))-methyltransferase [Leptolyngbyaceae bacterium]|nr:16S rRNA (cytosine(967)-C(5))-methyltransferase [Leptolyngbyaceae bacterium]
MQYSHQTSSGSDARQLALSILLRIEKGAFADEALHQGLATVPLSSTDRSFVTELVYGTTRRRRTLDEIIQTLAKAKGDRPPRLIHLILRLGLYQLRYLDQVPDSAAVNTSVELAKQNRLGGLSGFVNGVLRAYTRQRDSVLQLPADAIARLGILHSYPDWIVRTWQEQLAPSDPESSSGNAHQWEQEVEALCEWFNQPPSIDLRVNPLRSSVEQVREAFAAASIATDPIPGAPQGLRLTEHSGLIQSLPGYDEGWWTVQDGSAQLVGHLLNPQPEETVIDACAAPGGKTTHLAELMGDRGTVWACDRNEKRLNRVQENLTRLNLTCIQLHTHDMRSPHADLPQADRVLVDAPCSGLGTLHRHADARWRQSPERISELTDLQRDLLQQSSRYVKPGGTLVYATCTLNPQENQAIVQAFLQNNSHWAIAPLSSDSPLYPFQTSEGWLTLWPHRQNLDGFFMARLQHSA